MPMQQMLLGGGGAGVEPPGQVTFTATGSHTWTVPSGVTSVSVVCIGAGNAAGYTGGGGGALAYGNNISVTPGASISLQVGLKENSGLARHSYFIDANTLQGGGGMGDGGGISSGSERDGGGNGGDGAQYSSWASYKWGGGGGGAGGYNGDGGDGGVGTSGSAGSSDGAGGGGGAGSVGGCNGGGGGGGSGLIGTTSSSTAGLGGDNSSTGGQGGDGQGNAGCNASGGVCTTQNVNGRTYGGGRGGVSSGRSCTDPYPVASNGAVKIIWPGDTRTFPSNCADV